MEVIEKDTKLAINRHPLMVDEGVEWYSAEFLENECIGEYLIRHKIKPPQGHLTVLVNSQVPAGLWPLYVPAPGDVIIISARAAGGAVSKVGRIIGLVAVAAAGIATAGLVTPLLGPIAGGVAAGVVMAGGSMLINSLLPTPKTQAPTVEEKKESPTYGINGGRNRINQYGPMALVFGRHKMVPYLGAKPYVTFAWEDNYYHQIFHFGLQPDLIVENMRIGENPISNYQGVDIERSDEWGGIYSIAGNVDMQEGFELKNTDGMIERRGPEDTTRITVDISSTLFQIDLGSGAYVYNFSIVQAQYRRVGTEDWLPLGPGANGPDPGGYQLFGFDANKPVRVVASQEVERGQYDVRFWKPVQDQEEATKRNDTAISLIRFYQADDTDYTGQLRYGITIKASGQLQNTIDELSAIVSARCMVWTGDSWEYRETSNPAWWLLFFARGKRDEEGNLIYGEGLSDNDIDIDAIKAWARFCDDHNLTFNWILDRQMKVAEVLATIARAGRATTSRSIGKRTVVWDAWGKPTQYMLTPANVVAGSFEITYINQDVVDVIEANFTNAELDYKADTVRQRVPNTPITDNPITIDLEGITNADQAGREVNLIAADQWFHKRQYSWQMDTEGAVMRKGEIAMLGYDFHSYEYAGRVLECDPERKRLVLDGVINGDSVWFVLRDGQGNIGTTRITVRDASIVYLDEWPNTGPNDNVGAPFIPPTAENAHDYLWYFSPTKEDTKQLLITGVEPQDEYKVKFTAIDYDSRYYDTEYDIYSHAPRRQVVVKNQILYLTASEARQDDGTVIVRFSWELAQRGEQVYVQTSNDQHHESFTTNRSYFDVPAKVGDTVTANVSLTNGDYKTLTHVVQGGLSPTPEIANVTATKNLVNKIAVEWLMPLNHPSVRVTEVWGAPVENGVTGDRRKLSDVTYPENSFVHFVDGPGKEWRYWVRLVDKNGNPGEFYPAGDGALGSTTNDYGKIIDSLGREAFESEIGKALTEPLGDMQEEIDAANAELAKLFGQGDDIIEQAREELQAARNEINAKIESSQKQAQDLEDRIEKLNLEVGSNLAASLEDIDNAKAELNQTIADNKDQLERSINQTLIESKAYADGLVSTATTNLTQQLDDQSAAFDQSIDQARAYADEAAATKVQSLRAVVDHVNDRVTSNAHAINNNMNAARAYADRAVAKSAQDLEAKIEGQSDAIADSLTQAKAYTDSAISSRADDLRATLEGQSEAIASNLTQAKAYTDRAITTSQSVMQSKLDDATEGINQTIRDVEASIDGTVSTRLDSLKSTFDEKSQAFANDLTETKAYADRAVAQSAQDLRSEIEGANANIQNLQKTYADDQKSTSSQIGRLQSQMGGKYPDAPMYDRRTRYEAGTVVVHNGHYWQTDRGTTGYEPTPTSFWKDLGTIEENAGTDLRQALNLTARDAQVYADRVVSNAQQTLRAEIKEGDAKALNDAVSRAETYADKAVADNVREIGTQIEDNSSKISGLEKTFADQNETNSIRFDQMDSVFGGKYPEAIPWERGKKIEAWQVVTYKGRYYQPDRGNTNTPPDQYSFYKDLGPITDGALSSANITRINKSLADNEKAIANQESRVNAKFDEQSEALNQVSRNAESYADRAAANRASQLEARIEGNESKISSLQTTVTNDQESTSRRIDQVQSVFGGRYPEALTYNPYESFDKWTMVIYNGRYYEATTRTQAGSKPGESSDWRDKGAITDGAISSATINNIAKTAADAEQAVSDYGVEINNKIGDINSRIAINAQDISNQWNESKSALTMRVEQDGDDLVAAGIGLGVAPWNGKQQSYVLFDTDTFAIRNADAPNGRQYPFYIENGRTYINDAFINQADIANATIGTLQARDAVINGRNISDGAISDAIVEQETFYGYRGQLHSKYFDFGGNARIAIVQVLIMGYDDDQGWGRDDFARIVMHDRTVWQSEPDEAGQPYVLGSPPWPSLPISSMFTNRSNIQINFYPKFEGSVTVEYSIALFKK